MATQTIPVGPKYIPYQSKDDSPFRVPQQASSSREGLRREIASKRSSLTMGEMNFLGNLLQEGGDDEFEIARAKLADKDLFFEPSDDHKEEYERGDDNNSSSKGNNYDDNDNEVQQQIEPGYNAALLSVLSDDSNYDDSDDDSADECLQTSFSRGVSAPVQPSDDECLTTSLSRGVSVPVQPNKNISANGMGLASSVHSLNFISAGSERRRRQIQRRSSSVVHKGLWKAHATGLTSSNAGSRRSISLRGSVVAGGLNSSTHSKIGLNSSTHSKFGPKKNKQGSLDSSAHSSNSLNEDDENRIFAAVNYLSGGTSNIDNASCASSQFLSPPPDIFRMARQSMHAQCELNGTDFDLSSVSSFPPRIDRAGPVRSNSVLSYSGHSMLSKGGGMPMNHAQGVFRTSRQSMCAQRDVNGTDFDLSSVSSFPPRIDRAGPVRSNSVLSSSGHSMLSKGGAMPMIQNLHALRSRSILGASLDLSGHSIQSGLTSSLHSTHDYSRRGSNYEGGRSGLDSSLNLSGHKIRSGLSSSLHSYSRRGSNYGRGRSGVDSSIDLSGLRIQSGLSSSLHSYTRRESTGNRRSSHGLDSSAHFFSSLHGIDEEGINTSDLNIKVPSSDEEKVDGEVLEHSDGESDCLAPPKTFLLRRASESTYDGQGFEVEEVLTPSSGATSTRYSFDQDRAPSFLIEEQEDDKLTSDIEDDERLNAWDVLTGEYAMSAVGYGANGTLPFIILGTSADDIASTPHVLSPPIMESLQSYLPFAKSEDNFWMKYSMARDGASLHTLLQNIRGATHSIIAIETVDGEVIGSFTSTTWRKNWNYFGTGESFLWRMKRNRDVPCHSVIDQAFLESELDVFRWTGDNNCIQLCKQDMIAVGGGTIDDAVQGDDKDDTEYGFGLAIGSDLLYATSSHCATFGSPPLSKKNSDGSPMEIVNMEVWTLTPCLSIEEAERLELGRLFLEDNSRM